VANIHAIRRRFKVRSFPPVVPPCHESSSGPPIRREGKPRETERDLKKFTDYLFIERGNSPGTVKKYVSAVKQLKEWARGKRKSLSQLTTSACQRWLLAVAKKAPITTSTINGKHCAAAVFFHFLMTEGDVNANPFESIDYLPKDETLPRFLSKEELDLLMRRLDTSTYAGLLDRVVMELLYATGMRIVELINLRFDNLDLERRCILCIGKGSKERLVIFGRDARKWLKKYLTARAKVPGAKKCLDVFLKSDGKKLYGTYVWRHVKEHGLMAGLKDVSPHILRHSFATHLRAGGASIRHIQALLGHGDMESTEVYTHLVPAHLRKTYDQHHPRSGLKRRPPHRRRRWWDVQGEEVEE
jgi:integrase/recombinase XerD